MTILVHSRADDLHAAAVCWGLAEIGAPFLFWPAGEFPRSQALSASISDEEDRHLIETGGERYDLHDVRTVWNRRQGRASVRPDLDGRDADFARDQSVQHLDSYLSTMCPSALWVNRPEVARAELQKIGQLRTARQVGLSIPATLFSNDPEEIRSFFERQDRDVVYKAYKLKAWTEEGSGAVFVNYTSALSERDLAEPDVLSAAPGIFQRRVEKDCEVRVTVLGREVVGVRLDGPASAAIDWRSQPKHLLHLSHIVLPDNVRAKCLEYMRLSNLAFCCFDFILTPGGEYVFLEANQMGQFLWIEEKLPELPLLDMMCAFLISGTRDFEWKEAARRLSFADYPAFPPKAREAGAPAA